MAAGAITFLLLSLLSRANSDREGFFYRQTTWAGAWPWPLLVHEVVKVSLLPGLSFLAGKGLAPPSQLNIIKVSQGKWLHQPSQDIRIAIVS